MSQPLFTANDALAWHEHTATAWRKALADDPAILTLPCTVAKTKTAGELLQHIVAVELRYAERLNNLPASDYSTIPYDTVETIYATHDRATELLRQALDANLDWDTEIEFVTRMMRTGASHPEDDLLPHPLSLDASLRPARHHHPRARPRSEHLRRLPHHGSQTRMTTQMDADIFKCRFVLLTTPLSQEDVRCCLAAAQNAVRDSRSFSRSLHIMHTNDVRACKDRRNVARDGRAQPLLRRRRHALVHLGQVRGLGDGLS